MEGCPSMAEARKTYPLYPIMLLNIANDIVEMYKADVDIDDRGRFGFTTEMYGKKVKYLFNVTQQPDGCELSIITDGEDERAAHRLAFMFSIVDSMLAQLTALTDDHLHKENSLYKEDCLNTAAGE